MTADPGPGRASGPRAAAFLDRDGTIIDEAEYLSDPEGVVLIPGAAAAIRRLREAGLAVVVVTNQSGIARGFYGEEDYQAVARRVDELLEARGAAPDGTWYCPHHPDVTGPCACRKPGPGMYREAAEALALDLAASFYVGDKISDVEPARAFGGTGILVRTGYGADSERDAPPWVVVADDLADAVGRILAARSEGPGGGG